MGGHGLPPARPPIFYGEGENMASVKTIRKKCVDCSDGNADIKNCWADDCPLWPARMGHRPKGFQPQKAIKKFCMWCCLDQRTEIKLCAADECVLWVHRPWKGETTLTAPA